jgi:[acyl-carrier-protein] S-malonyltransferase
MEPAKAGLVDAVKSLQFNDPTVPIVANCTGRPLSTGEEVRDELITQICSCVRWNDSIDYMLGSGVSQFIEVGPGRALSSMVKRIDISAEAISVGDIDAILRLRRN